MGGRHALESYVDEAVSNATTSEEGFRARLNGTQNLSASTHTKLVFGVEDHDDGGNYNDATGEWTVPDTGWYVVETFVRYTSVASGERVMVSFYVDGSDYQRIHDRVAGAAVGTYIAGGTLVMHRTAGEVVAVYGWRANAGDVVGNATMRPEFAAIRRY